MQNTKSYEKHTKEKRPYEIHTKEKKSIRKTYEKQIRNSIRINMKQIRNKKKDNTKQYEMKYEKLKKTKPIRKPIRIKYEKARTNNFIPI